MADILGSHFNAFAVKIGVGIGLIQGVIWGVLSFTAIVWHLVGTHRIFVSYAKDTYPFLLDAHIFYSFIKNNVHSTTMYVQPGTFFGVMLGYFFISVVWLGASIYVYFAYRRQSGKAQMKFSLVLWIIAASSAVILDLIFFIFLTIDYDSIVKYYNEVQDVTQKLAYVYSSVAYGIVMMLAARGFVLWFINFILTAVLIKIYVDVRNMSPNETYNAAVSSRRGSRIRADNLPEEARQGGSDAEPVRRHTAPPPPSSFNVGGTTPDNFTPRGIFLNFDPEVEFRLSKYKMTPNQLKNRFR